MRLTENLVLLDLGDDLGVVGTLFGQPEDGGRLAGAGAGDGQLDPILDRGVLGLAHAPDVTGFHGVLEHHVAGVVGDLDHAIGAEQQRIEVQSVI
ncbi:hypothetical protein G6F23_015205 [Rhizopus arrhizus]|nr:hypothetical protein G6F23_015205 [Rhizopus arrhizus]